jgi:hypothetical protein
MDRSCRFNIPGGNDRIMSLRGIIIAGMLLMLLLLCSGCMQPDKTPPAVPKNITPAMSAPVSLQAVGTIIPMTPSVIPSGTTPSLSVSPTIIPQGRNGPVDYQHYAGPDYSIDYPSAWETNVTSLPLREYKHSRTGCAVTFAYQLDQELRFYSSGDGGTLFYSSIVDTPTDIWPRNLNRQINYADIVNSILGNPDYCAGTPVETFTISDITQVPLNGVSYTGTRVDFGRINATGFTEGTGSSYIVTGKNRHGVFTFFSTSPDDRTAQDAVMQYMFNSLRLNSAF